VTSLRRISLVSRYTKTVKLDIVLGENCEIIDVVVSGDFFAYPEEAIERLESKLKKCNSRTCVEEAFGEISGAVILGIDIADLKNRIAELLENCTTASLMEKEKVTPQP
jgi:hypothetical protein